MTSEPAEMPNHALPPATNTLTTAIVMTIRPEVVKLRCIMACIETVSASRAARSATSNRSRSKSSRPQVLTAKMFVTASDSTPESLFCAADVAAESGMMRLYISQTNAM